jgi:5'-3' exonuclease
VRHTVLCLDAPPYFRKALFPDYKAQRPAPEPELITAKREVLRRCEEQGYRLARADGFEGDDIVATLAAVYGLICEDVRIIGCDKDLFQLVRGPVRILRPAKGDKPEVLLDGPAIFKETGGVTPAMVVDWLALMGDAGDNIPGCPGVGDKRATIIIGQYGTLEKLYWSLEHEPVPTNRTLGKSICAKLNENKAAVFQARELVRLRIDAPVDANELLQKRKAQPKPAAKANPFPGDDQVQDNGFDAAVAAMPESGWPNPRRQPEAKLLDPTVAIPAGSPAKANLEMAAEAVAAAEPANEGKTPSSPPQSGPSVAKARPRPVIDTKGEPTPDVGKDGSPVTNIKRNAQAGSTTALVPQRGADVWDLALEPKSLKEAMWLTVEYHSVELFPELKSPQHYLAIIMMGRELGLGTMASLVNIHIVEGRPSPNWQLIVGFAQQHPDCEYFELIETTNERATYVTKRRQNKEPTTLTFTMEDAERTGLVKPFSGWDKFPAALLRKMCSVHLARAVYPDSKANGLYCPEELGARVRAA